MYMCYIMLNETFVHQILNVMGVKYLSLLIIFKIAM
jgi:hypothetical protein